MGHGNQKPETEHVRAFMTVLVTRNFDEDSIKNERTSMETPFSHYQSMGICLKHSKAAYSVVNSNLSEILCMFSLPASIKSVGPKTTKKRWRHHFPHYKSLGAFCCHGNQSFNPICTKTLCSLSPIPMMLHINFDQDRPNGFRDIQVQKCDIFITQGQLTPK